MTRTMKVWAAAIAALLAVVVVLLIVVVAQNAGADRARQLEACNDRPTSVGVAICREQVD